MAQALDEEAMKSLLKWIDSIPLSRPKKNLARDFSDGVLAAEIIKHYFPRMVEIHNYQNASSRAQKLTNWTTLNRKVLTKFGFAIPKEIIDDIIQSKNDAVVLFLFGLRRVIEDKLQNNAKNEVPQAQKADSMQSLSDQLSLTVRAGMPLSQLNIALLDTDTKLVLAEKEQALLASHETIKILQLKVSRLEQLLTLKDKRISELKKQVEERQAYEDH